MPNNNTEKLSDTLKLINNRIIQSCLKININPNKIKLVAVSKNQNIHDILSLISLGHTFFGENRLQESSEKWPDILKLHEKLDLHFIGKLQSNKVFKVLQLFKTIESIDSENILKKIAKFKAIEANYKYKHKFYIQINIGNEPQKSGVSLNEACDFLRMAREIYKIEISGAMGIAPLNICPIPYFKALKMFCIENKLKNISMGMSNDFELAIENGSNSIRVGTALFGVRKDD